VAMLKPKYGVAAASRPSLGFGESSGETSPVLWIIVRLVAGLLLFGLGAFSAIMSPLITDSGTQEAIRAFEIVLCLSLLVAVLGIALMIWGIVGIFRH
jgi:hypothetical protein